MSENEIKASILAVDDNPDNLFVLEQLIADGLPHCNLVTTTNAQEGLSIASKMQFDGALIDVQMPGMDGIEMCRRLKADAATRDIQVILVTAHEASGEINKQGLDAGAIDFISKPIDNVELMARIRSMLRVRRVEDKLRKMNANLDRLVNERTHALLQELENRKNAENALKESQEQLSSIFDSIDDYVLLLDTDHRIGMINNVLPGMEREKVVGALLHEITSRENRARLKKQLDLVIKSAQKQEWDSIYIKPDGVKLHFSSVASPIVISGKVVGSVVSARDVTERFKLESERELLEEQFRQAQKMEAVGRLAGGIAHDFNNILSVIINYSEFASEELHEGDPLKADILEIQSAGDRAAVLTRQLLSFSRKQIVEKEVLDIDDVIENVEKMLVRLIGEDINFETNLSKDLQSVEVDPGQLEQVLMNLAVNSRDAMPLGGKLVIETSNVELDQEYAESHADAVAGQYVLLAITDTGSGMTAEVKEHLFEPFYTTKTQGKGTGLGLATVYGIVKQSGGSIWVDSQPGNGTTFNIYLPVVDAELTIPKRKTSTTALKGTETILVVEDDENVRFLTKRILESAGYNVEVASNGGEALLICEQDPDRIQLMITDVIMPQMSGKELSIRLAEICPDMKVLFMSGYTDDAISHHGILDRGTHFIAKPFTSPEMLKKIRMVLESDWATDSIQE